MATTLRWPVSLPQSLPVGTIEDGPANTVRTETDAGPALVRRRFTAVPRTISPPAEKFVLGTAERSTMLHFYLEQCGGGALSFMWREPMPDYGDVEMRFLTRPRFTSLVPGGPGRNSWFACEVQFEVLP